MINKLTNLSIEQLKKSWNQLNKRAVVLMYHRIFDTNFDPRQLCVSPKNFEEQLQIIKKYGQLLQMRQMSKDLKNFSLGPIKFILTFDDGYADNFQFAAPILKRHGVPATFFLVTGVIGKQEEFFGDSLERTILAPETLPDTFDMSIDDKNYCWQILPEGRCRTFNYSYLKHPVPFNDKALSRNRLYITLNHLGSSLPSEKRQLILKYLEKWSKRAMTVRSDCFPMTLDELKSMADCPLFEIGAHTASHPRLSYLPAKSQEEEISLSKEFLENTLNRPVESFAYPYGNYSQETVKIVEHLDFSNACTVEQQTVMNSTNPYLLPRFFVPNCDGHQFEENLQKWLM